VIPQHFHVADFILNSLNLLVAVVDQLGVAEFLSGVAKVTYLDVKFVDFCVYGLKLSKCILASALVLVEIALLQVLSVNLKILFQLSDLVIVLLGLTLNKRRDFLVSLLCNFLKVSPVFEKLFGLLDLRILGQTLGLQEVECFFKLVELQHD